MNVGALGRRLFLCRTCRQNIYNTKLFRRTVSGDASQLHNVEGIPPALIARARKMALQHQELEQKAASINEYTPQLIQLHKRISELTQVAENLKELEENHANILELQKLISSSNDKEMISLARDELDQSTERLESLKEMLKSSLIPRHPQAHLPCIMEFKRGVGGDDAAHFALDLYKMYQRFASTKGWTWKVMSYTSFDGGGDGIVDAVVSVSSTRGDDVYGTLRHEAGVHRVQRIPITESQGRIHTSAAAVLIFPQVENESKEEEHVLDMDEVKVEVMRSRGAGGQHVNKTESAVRMTHMPTGIVVAIQDSRSQHENKAAALTILRSRVAAKREEERKAEALKIRNKQVTSNDRSDKIRTWTFNQNRVTDHRGFKYNDLRGCMEGDSLGEFIEGVAKVMQQIELEEALEED